MKKIILAVAILIFTCTVSQAQFKLFKKKDKTSADTTQTAIAEPKKEKKTLKEKIFGKKSNNKSDGKIEEPVVETAWPEGTLTYQEFWNDYKPHGIRSHPRTILTNEMLDAKTGASMIKQYTREGDKNALLRTLANGDRKKVMVFLDKLKPNEIVDAFKLLDNDWAIELAWYVNEKTYNIIAPKVDAIKNYRLK
ncbi:MAG: hypothetical protein KA319_03740 [Ferruginibacter sp.]|nr:hypothetical protein [Ferruginibacter sp.]